MRHPLAGPAVFALAAWFAVPAAALAQESQSAALAGELARLLTQQNLDSAAAHQVDDRFVAALFFPGAQLLVVSAKYPMPDRIEYLLEQRQYRDAYVDLQGASDQQSKIFITDLGANGLQFRRERDDQPFDLADLPGVSVAFDGEWGGGGRISEADYRQAFETADREYAQMLQALIGELKKSS